MKKVVIGVIILLVLIGGGVAAYVAMNPKSDIATVLTGKTNDSLSTTDSFVSVNACDVLTDNIAEEILGKDTLKVSTPANSAESIDMTVSSCTYTTKIEIKDAKSVPTISGITLVVKAAKTTAGANSNKTQFVTKPDGVTEVENIGDDAFYSPDFMQLNVISGNNWYVINRYKDTATNSSLELNKQVAEKLSYR